MNSNDELLSSVLVSQRREDQARRDVAEEEARTEEPDFEGACTEEIKLENPVVKTVLVGPVDVLINRWLFNRADV